jgi:DNA-binding transcriptional LysR family regulator
MDMFDRLRHFVLVADHGTLTAAAHEAHVTQPALTASIQRLEADMGARLLVRGHKRTELTAAGSALLPRARAAMAAVEAGRRAVTEVMGLERGSVRLGAGATVCTYYLPPLLARFRERFPRVQIFVREAVTDEIVSALERGELDLGVITRSGGEPWLDDELVLVTSPKGPYRPGAVDPETAPFVSFPQGSTTRDVLDRHFPRAEVVMELAGIAAVKGNVRAGVGIALVSRRAVERDLRSKVLALIRHPATPIVRPFSIVHRGEERMPPAAAALYAMLRDPAARAVTAPRTGSPAGGRRARSRA